MLPNCCGTFVPRSGHLPAFQHLIQRPLAACCSTTFGSQQSFSRHCRAEHSPSSVASTSYSSTASCFLGSIRLPDTGSLPRPGSSVLLHSASRSQGKQLGSSWVGGAACRQRVCHSAARTESAHTRPQAAATTISQEPSKKPRYSPLHYNVEEFCQRIVPAEQERVLKHQVIEGIRVCTRKAFPDMRKVDVEVFGSFANGLSTWNSDVDLVVTGLMEPDRVTGVYDITDRGKVTARLRKIAEQLRRYKKLEIKKMSIIARARMPIIKLKTKHNVAVDISISDDSGPRAARFMLQQARAYPTMRPLVLVLKSYLRSQNLNDVSTGGLSSYSLSNMVICHLQEELKCGRDIFDLGETLYSFLLRFGEEFDYERDAVSIASGGVVPKAALGFAIESARFAASTSGYYDSAASWFERLCVDCPLSGRDVSSGTYRIDIVRNSLNRAARKLEALAKGRKMTDTSINYLQALFDVNRVIKRSYADADDAYNRAVEREVKAAEAAAAAGVAAGSEDENEFFELADGDDDELLQEPTRVQGGSKGGKAGR